MQPTPHTRRTPRILLVDDQAPMRELLSLYFRKQGLHVTLATNGGEARRLDESETYDLIILDLHLAGENGLELLGYVKAKCPQVPLILVTGMGCDAALVAQARAGGANAFMSKTGSLGELFAQVRDLLPPTYEPQADFTAIINRKAIERFKRRILVVDDDPPVCETVAMLLKSDGHQVATAAGSIQALDLFQPDRFDLVITDFFMPHMSGGELAQAIKRRAPSQPIVLLTASPERFRGTGQKLNGVETVLDKPIYLECLREAVSRFAVENQLLEQSRG